MHPFFVTEIDRRKFLEFLGRGTALTMAGSLTAPLLSCATAGKPGASKGAHSQPFTPLKPSSEDALLLADGFRYSIIASWGDPIRKGLQFGMNNDFTAFFPLKPGVEDDGLLWVNHEYPDPLFQCGYEYKKPSPRKKKDVTLELESVGGSIIRIRRDSQGEWKLVPNDPLNRRITGLTKIPLVADRPIAGSRVAVGTNGNCAGGVTPWRTVLTCEEFYGWFFGNREYVDGKPGKINTSDASHGWEQHYPFPPEHYNWVVEVDPFTGKAKKLTALGRFGHECATVRQAPDGRCVVYSGDDDTDQFIYKFISDMPGSLERGTLYVADTKNGRWISLDRSKQPLLQKNYPDQLEVLIQARKAASELGATPQDRPEDIEIDPATGAVLITLTNNSKRKNYFGSILRIREKNNDPLALEFEADTFKTGGPDSGFACPDNLAFDKRGNLWFTSDISGRAMNKEPYTQFKNNGLFYVPMSGSDVGQIFQVASAPVGAELTGPSFSPDGKTLFLSVQHPGEYSESLDKLSSHWPGGGTSLPRPSVVTISGPVIGA